MPLGVTASQRMARTLAADGARTHEKVNLRGMATRVMKDSAPSCSDQRVEVFAVLGGQITLMPVPADHARPAGMPRPGGEASSVGNTR
jgi:hypothetical protein